MEYVGHLITKEGVFIGPKKIVAMKEWPIHNNIKQLKGFLGLTEYYRRFIKHYGHLCKPLTDLLNKNAFHWDDMAQHAFDQLKQALLAAPVLTLPYFNKVAVVETDASDSWIGAVLTQKGHPIAYLSKALSPTHYALLSMTKNSWQ